MITKANVEEKVLTLKWLMQEEKLARFEEMTETFVISDKVAEFDFTKAGVVKGTQVNVKIERNGTEGTVVFMTKVKGQQSAPRTESQPTTQAPTQTAPASTTSDAGTKELTVKGLAKKTRGIIFAEQENVWYTLAQDIDIEGLYAKGVKQGSKVKITVIPPEGRSKNEIITKIEVLAEPEKKQWSGKKNYKSDYDNPERQRSIESQAAVNAANRVVASMVTSTTDADTVLKMIRKIAEANLALIDELKSK